MSISKPVAARLSACTFVILARTLCCDAAWAASDPRPAWVISHWGAKTHDNGRAIYGVGMAKPQGDVRALRGLAQTEAKAAALRQVAVFAAAVQENGLPQGRALATGLQAFAPLLERLVRPMDHWVDADGTHYSLMAVQANTLMAAAQKARDKGLTLETLDAAGFEAAFDKVAQVDGPVSAFVGVADSGWSDTVPKQDLKQVPQSFGPEPAWVQQGASATLPSSIYLCGLGKGKSRSAAAGGGATALTNSLMAPAAAAASAAMAARAPLGLSGAKGHDPKEAAKQAWAAVAPYLLAQQVWVDKKGNHVAASCVLRVKAYAAAKERLKTYDTQIGGALQLASRAAAGSDAQKDNLNKAFVALQERAALAAMLRGINISGLGQAGPYMLSDVAAAQNPLSPRLVLAVAAEGPYWLGLANAVVDGAQNPNVVPGLVAVTPQHDLLLTAKISLAPKEGKNAKNAQGQYQAQGEVRVQLEDVRRNKVLLQQTFEASASASAHIFEAERAVMRKLNEQASDATHQALATLP